MRRGERTPPSGWRWLAIVCSAAAAMVFAAPAAAATAGVTNCSEVAIGYVFTFSGSGFASNSVVAASVDGAPRGTTVTDNRGNFANFSVLVFTLPADVLFVDSAGNSVLLTVRTCGGGGGGGGGGGNGDDDEGDVPQPVVKRDCKQGGFLTFADLAFKNQGHCVSTVASKNR